MEHVKDPNRDMYAEWYTDSDEVDLREALQAEKHKQEDPLIKIREAIQSNKDPAKLQQRKILSLAKDLKNEVSW